MVRSKLADMVTGSSGHRLVGSEDTTISVERTPIGWTGLPEIRQVRRQVRGGVADRSLTALSGMAALTELVDRLGVVELLDEAGAPITLERVISGRPRNVRRLSGGSPSHRHAVADAITQQHARNRSNSPSGQADR
jgi:hypothetical protein